MIKKPTIIKAGTLLAVTEGEYSDYGIICLVRVKQDFEMVATFPVRRASGRILADLLANDTLEELSYSELHLPERVDRDRVWFREIYV